MREWIFIVGVFAIVSFVGAAGAQGGIGTSSILFSSSHVSVSQGSAASVNYTVKLASGSAWGTTLGVVNQGALSGEGISVSLSDTYGDPTYSGTMNIHVGSAVPAGSYNISLVATGDDPSPQADLALNVLQSPVSTISNQSTAAPSTTAPSTTVLSTTAPSTSTIPATTAPHTQNATQFLYIGIVAVVVIIVAIAAYLLFRKRA